MNAPNTQIIVSKQSLSTKINHGSDLFPGAGNVQGRSGTSGQTRQQGGYQRLLGWWQKGSGSYLSKLPLAKGKTIWVSNKNNNCNGLNPWIQNDAKQIIPLIGHFWRTLRNQLIILKNGKNQKKKKNLGFVLPFLSCTWTSKQPNS